MSFNPYQQFKVNHLLETDFRKVYDCIPENFKANFYFQHFLCELASLERKIDQAQPREQSVCKQSTNWITDFQVEEENEVLSVTANYMVASQNLTDKEKMKMCLYPDGTLSFSWVLAYIPSAEKYIPASYDTLFELRLRPSQDGKQLLTEYMISDCSPYQLELVSIFDQDNNEIYRYDKTRNKKTSQILSQEEFSIVPQENIELAVDFFDGDGENSLEILQMYDGNASMVSLSSLQNIKELYVGKCTVNSDTRYAVCFKPKGFANGAYEKTFESITSFGNPTSNLFYALDKEQKPYVKEISQDSYQQLTQLEINKNKILKKASHYGK